MREAIQVVNINPEINEIIEASNSRGGTPNPILPIIAIGEVNGIIESHILIVP